MRSRFPNGRDVDPSVAGPVTWVSDRLFVDSLPDNPDENTQKATIDRLSSLQYVFPCSMCRYHLTQMWKERPLELPVTRTKASRWLWESYNSVNKRIGKPTIPYTEWIREYKRWCTYKKSAVFFENQDSQVVELRTTRPTSLTYENNLDESMDVFYDTIKRPNHMASYIFSTAVTVVIAILILIVSLRVLFAKRRRIRNRQNQHPAQSQHPEI